MLTVKFMTYGGDGEFPDPTYTEHIAIRPASAVYIELTDIHGRTVVKIVTPEGEHESFTLGDHGRDDVMHHCAYIMNAEGKTVETLRFNRKAPPQHHKVTNVTIGPHNIEAA